MTANLGRGEPDRPLEGLGTFAWKIGVASVVAVVAVALVLLVRGDRADAPRAEATRTGAVTAPARAPPRPAVERGDDLAETPEGREVDRRHAAGELSDAQRRFEPCPGGDVRRVAWIDPQQRVRKLVRFRSGGLVLAQWFDDEGRLREAVVHTTTGGRPWTRRVTLDERGREMVQDSPRDAVPDEPPPSLVRGDPSSAFFAGPGCSG